MFEAYEQILTDVSTKLGMNRDWLRNVIQLESGFDPKAYNKSGAVGLIQFMPQTLKDFGLLSPSMATLVPSFGPVPENVKQMVRTEFLAKYPTVESQLLGPVLTYFRRYKSYPTEQSVYLTVFYPAYREASLDTAFSPLIQSQNPGITTVQDYVNLVNRKATTAKVMKAGLPLLAVGVAAVAWYMYSS